MTLLFLKPNFTIYRGFAPRKPDPPFQAFLKYRQILLMLTLLWFRKPQPAVHFCSDFTSQWYCTFLTNLQNNFQDHRRLSEQLFGSQAAIRKPEQASWIGCLEGLSQLVGTWFHRRKQKTLIWMFFTQKTAKNCYNHQHGNYFRLYIHCQSCVSGIIKQVFGWILTKKNMFYVYLYDAI